MIYYTNIHKSRVAVKLQLFEDLKNSSIFDLLFSYENNMLRLSGQTCVHVK